MYQKPMVERPRTFRELTRNGFSGANDGMTLQGAVATIDGRRTAEPSAPTASD